MMINVMRAILMALMVTLLTQVRALLGQIKAM